MLGLPASTVNGLLFPTFLASMQTWFACSPAGRNAHVTQGHVRSMQLNGDVVYAMQNLELCHLIEHLFANMSAMLPAL